MHHRMRYLLISLYAAISISPAQGQTVSPTHIVEFPHFRLIPGNVDSDGFPTAGAKLCLLKPANDCYQMPSNTGYSSGSVVYTYGLDPRSERLSLKGGGSLVFFSAQFSGGGSGTLDSLAILRYESDGKIVKSTAVRGVNKPKRPCRMVFPRRIQLSNFGDCRFCLDRRRDTFRESFLHGDCLPFWFQK
jgi:hypothetical protein